MLTIHTLMACFLLSFLCNTYSSCAEQKGVSYDVHSPSEKLYALGMQYKDVNDIENTLHFFNAAARLGHPDAAYASGSLYLSLGELHQSFNYFRLTLPIDRLRIKSCAKIGVINHYLAQTDLAIKNLLPAAQLGSRSAMFNLAMVYAHDTQYDKAHFWLHKSALRKTAFACLELFYLHETGNIKLTKLNIQKYLMLLVDNLSRVDTYKLQLPFRWYVIKDFLQKLILPITQETPCKANGAKKLRIG